MRVAASALLTFGLALLGTSQFASAGWVAGQCTSTGPAPCIEYFNGTSWSHFNGDGGHADIWHGPSGDAPDDQDPGTRTNTFEFCGDTSLTCGSAVVECELCLYGQVRKCYDDSNSTWKVGIRVMDADVTGGAFSLCGFVSVTGFPWYIDENSEHGPYSNDCDVGIPYDSTATPTIDLIGSIGPIGVSVPLLGINVTNGHMHDITYNNIDTFVFGVDWRDEIIYNSSEGSTGCTVTGSLEMQPSNNILSIQ